MHVYYQMLDTLVFFTNNIKITNYQLPIFIHSTFLLTYLIVGKHFEHIIFFIKEMNEMNGFIYKNIAR